MPAFFILGKKKDILPLDFVPVYKYNKAIKKRKEAEKMKMITLEEAAEILKQRGEAMEVTWLRKKAAAGTIPGAVKIGSPKKGMWLIPRKWAESYIKDTRGRKRKS